VVAILAAYTVALIAVLGGRGESQVRTVTQSSARERSLSPVERRVSRAVRTAPLFQRESEDVPAFRQPRVASVRCESGCRVVYAVAVPGRGRILYQQQEMVRRIFQDTRVSRVVLRVVRVAPTGPEARPVPEEETPAGFPLMETVCDRGRLTRRVDWRTQEQAQAALVKACTVRDFDQGRLHGGGRGADKPAPGGGSEDPGD